MLKIIFIAVATLSLVFFVFCVLSYLRRYDQNDYKRSEFKADSLNEQNKLESITDENTDIKNIDPATKKSTDDTKEKGYADVHTSLKNKDAATRTLGNDLTEKVYTNTDQNAFYAALKVQALPYLKHLRRYIARSYMDKGFTNTKLAKLFDLKDAVKFVTDANLNQIIPHLFKHIIGKYKIKLGGRPEYDYNLLHCSYFFLHKSMIKKNSQNLELLQNEFKSGFENIWLIIKQYEKRISMHKYLTNQTRKNEWNLVKQKIIYTFSFFHVYAFVSMIQKNFFIFHCTFKSDTILSDIFKNIFFMCYGEDYEVDTIREGYTTLDDVSDGEDGEKNLTFNYKRRPI